jgi:hypothetical protein
VSFSIDVDPSLTIRATLPRLRQTLLSLLLDALDAVDAAGTITVTASVNADGCLLQLIDTRAGTPQPSTTNATSEIASQPPLTREQWWQALVMLVRAEHGALDCEQTVNRYVVRLRLPSGGNVQRDS